VGYYWSRSLIEAWGRSESFNGHYSLSVNGE
jgi:hypothetical protein